MISIKKIKKLWKANILLLKARPDAGALGLN